MRKPIAAVASAFACLLPVDAALATQVYGGLGLPGVAAGIAHPLNPSMTLRADFTGLPSMTMERTEDGIRYNGRSTVRRLGLFADWFAFGNGFRITGGLTVNQIRLDLQGRPEGGTITIGQQDYIVGEQDRFDARISFPRVTPYIGLGWGHRQGERGWALHADLGVSIGRARVSAQASGALAQQPDIQENIDLETAELREGAGRIRAIPQISVGVSYRF